MKKILPKELTSYDLLKSLALILMICDHVGHHFYPDEMWFRVFGRMCIPIWFFLIGYANNAELSKSLWIGGAIVVASAVISGQYIFPINILFTILILRRLRQWTVLRTFHSLEAMRGMFFLIIFLYIPTQIMFEYGALGMLMVLFGFMTRNKEAIQEVMEKKYLIMFAAASTFACFVALGIAMPYINEAQLIVMMVGYTAIGFLLWHFKPMEFPQARSFMAGSFISILQFMGRRTLEIYVVHLVLFRGIAMYLYPEQYAFMNVQFAPEGVLAMLGVQ